MALELRATNKLILVWTLTMLAFVRGRANCYHVTSDNDVINDEWFVPNKWSSKHSKPLGLPYDLEPVTLFYIILVMVQ